MKTKVLVATVLMFLILAATLFFLYGNPTRKTELVIIGAGDVARVFYLPGIRAAGRDYD